MFTARSFLKIALITAACAPLACGGNKTVTTCEASLTSRTSGAAAKLFVSPYGDTAAQSFKVSENVTISSVEIELKKIESVSGNLDGQNIGLQLRLDDGSGQPDTAAIVGATALVNIENISRSSAQFVTFPLTLPQALSAGTTYWIHVQVYYPTSTTNYVEWSGTTDTDAYEDGHFLVEDNVGNLGSSTTARDALFRLGCSES